MAENFYKDNPDLAFHLRHRDLEEAVDQREDGYKQAEHYPDAPESYDDALDSYEKVLDMLGELCAERIAPRAADVDEEGVHLEHGDVRYAEGTKYNLQDLTDAQLMGAMLPRRFGGLNMPVTVYNMMSELVSRADGSLQNLFGLQDIAQTIYNFGSEDQRKRYLPRFSRGEVDGAMALTEPEAGSDLQAVQLKAHYSEDDDCWYLNGMKRFITNGCAQVLLVLARSEEGTKDGRGLSMFLCEKCPGLTVRRTENKLGIHGSPTCELQFNNVPAELVGKRRRGLSRYVMSLMNGARVAISSQALGLAEAAYREGLKYAREREQFGSAIIRFPAVYQMLVYDKMLIVAGRTLLYEGTRYMDLQESYEWKIAQAESRDDVDPEDRKKAKTYSRIAAELTPLGKAFTTETANRVAYDAIQVHGGTGYMQDFETERYYRDARITNIYEGTTQLQYIAAIGGIMQRTLDPVLTELSHIPFEGKLRRLASAVDMAWDKLRKAVNYVSERDEEDFFELVTPRLCNMETIVYVAYLMLRDARIEPQREPLAERFVLDMLPQVDMEYEIVTRGDMSLIDDHQDILDY